MTTPTRVGFLGTGLMGAPMAGNLLAAGLEVVVWNRTAEKAHALEPLGAVVAADAASAAGDADVVVTMLEGGPVVDEVVFGTGVADAMEAGTTLIDMSSIPPRTAKEHAERLAERGLTHLDAPVSGGTRGAADGTLAIMVGGSETAFRRAAPVFEPLGTARRVGSAGAGQLAKLANQIIVGVTIGAVAEALLLGERSGVDPAALRDALTGGFADSRILREHGLRMLQRDFVAGGPARLHLKDMTTARDAARDARLNLPLTDLVWGLFTRLVDAGDADLDHSALLLALERLNAG